MANGVEVVQGKGVVPNFSIFTGDELIEKTQPYVMGNNFVGFPYSNEPTVEGYVTRMAIGNFSFHNFPSNTTLKINQSDSGSRLVRPTVSRKKQKSTN
jgi:hypothetical protein